jgi:NCAIR mutase (PurE)-related protein
MGVRSVTVKADEGSISRLFEEARVGRARNLDKDTVDTSEGVSGYATLDHDRGWRVGFPEVVFGEGKRPKEVYEICCSLGKGGEGVLATRVDVKGWEEVRALAREGGEEGNFSHSEAGRIVVYKAGGEDAGEKVFKTGSTVAVVTAGTTDIPVAEEAALTLEHTNTNVVRIYDCGVAGLHRIISHLPTLQSDDVDCVIVCAGMDGALPSVVAGLVKCPVIAVPTSVGYGASFGGGEAGLERRGGARKRR